MKATGFLAKMLGAALLLLASSGVACAAEGGAIDTGDTAWILASAALVLLMTPGLAMFYGGMVRKKNVLGTLMHSFIAIAVISVQWVLVGYSLSFGPDAGGFVGSLQWFGLKGVGLEPSSYAPTIPHLAFVIYQCMFAVITPALISGAFAERMKFSAYVLFILLWSTLIYDPIAHWIWGSGGWLHGTLDFAGGLVVHLSSGVSALVAALVIGSRREYLKEPIRPHNLPMTVLGAGLLWFGWFGFNAGSALASGSLSTLAFVTTHTAAATATVVWVVAEWLHRGKATMFGAATGAIAGLATITPAAGFVSPSSAMVIGTAAALLCYGALNMKTVLGYDDSLDAFGVHGIGGLTGTLGAGLFASLAINPGGANGLFLGNAHTLLVQVKAIGAVALYSVVGTLVILKALDWTVGLRVNEDQEVEGLDLSQHSEEGYFLS
ncbi:MAG: ammonium transporter [Nitrospirota bacterium]|jgi:Amt family ammonium transporter